MDAAQGSRPGQVASKSSLAVKVVINLVFKRIDAAPERASRRHGPHRGGAARHKLGADALGVVIVNADNREILRRLIEEDAFFRVEIAVN